MRFLRSRLFAVIAVGVLLAGTSTWLFANNTAKPDNDATLARVKRGEFKVYVTTAGELRARKFVQITLPAGAQQAEAYQM